VLSSGGKDSLLTFGLLHELGLEVHPLFVNESGRHWFTALNAYRHLARTVPRTLRVWTNADRVFTFLLRQIPFIRPDFARIRTDYYPLRLWTVAVFVFAALPVLVQRGIGRLVLGDEFDTTLRSQHRGVPHYAGLYDQSRGFDLALSRYFGDKGLDLAQFSILRPLSELLIQKLLVERYPELWAQQVSCHAAHPDGDRMRPCGQCEKCRRIVSMVVGLGADPRVCGYLPDQIKPLLARVAASGLHQESAGFEHLMHLLQARGQIPDQPRFQARPEVLKLRFHPDCSVPEDLPADLRPGLYRIFLDHAQKAVEQRGSRWVRIDPLARRYLDRPGPTDRNLRPSRA
jgi:hypothetical protein